MLCPVKTFFADLAALKLCAVHAELFQREKLGSCIHRASCDKDRRNVHADHADQIAWNALVAACDVHARVEGRCIRLNFDHVCDHLTACERIVDPVRSLALAVAHIRREVPRSVSARVGRAFAGFLHQSVKVPRARMAVPECALDENLRF